MENLQNHLELQIAATRRPRCLPIKRTTPLKSYDTGDLQEPGAMEMLHAAGKSHSRKNKHGIKAMFEVERLSRLRKTLVDPR